MAAGEPGDPPKVVLGSINWMQIMWGKDVQYTSYVESGDGDDEGDKSSANKEEPKKKDNQKPAPSIAQTAAKIIIPGLQASEYADAAFDEGDYVSYVGWILEGSAEMFLFVYTVTDKTVASGLTRFYDEVSSIFSKNVVNQGSKVILKNGYYEVNGFKYSEYYYNKLWNTGRGGSTFVAKNILEKGANTAKRDAIKGAEGFYKYIYDGWEMVYNPTTKEVWHIQPVK